VIVRFIRDRSNAWLCLAWAKETRTYCVVLALEVALLCGVGFYYIVREAPIMVALGKATPQGHSNG
jgi:hypothetical protein